MIRVLFKIGKIALLLGLCASCSEQKSDKAEGLLRVFYKPDMLPAQNICLGRACECIFAITPKSSEEKRIIEILENTPSEPFPIDDDFFKAVLEISYDQKSWAIDNKGYVTTFESNNIYINRRIRHKDIEILAEIFERSLTNKNNVFCQKGQIQYPYSVSVE